MATDRISLAALALELFERRTLRFRRHQSMSSSQSVKPSAGNWRLHYKMLEVTSPFEGASLCDALRNRPSLADLASEKGD